jgi:hypothetical protein
MSRINRPLTRGELLNSLGDMREQHRLSDEPVDGTVPSMSAQCFWYLVVVIEVGLLMVAMQP